MATGTAGLKCGAVTKQAPSRCGTWRLAGWLAAGFAARLREEHRVPRWCCAPPAGLPPAQHTSTAQPPSLSPTCLNPPPKKKKQQWYEKWWEVSDWKGMKEMGAEKWGCNDRGGPGRRAQCVPLPVCACADACAPAAPSCPPAPPPTHPSPQHAHSTPHPPPPHVQATRGARHGARPLYLTRPTSSPLWSGLRTSGRRTCRHARGVPGQGQGRGTAGHALHSCCHARSCLAAPASTILPSRPPPAARRLNNPYPCTRMHTPQGNEWEEKWGERYWSAGRADKWADKWAREGGDVWHEKWGENYDGAGAGPVGVVGRRPARRA